MQRSQRRDTGSIALPSRQAPHLLCCRRQGQGNRRGQNGMGRILTALFIFVVAVPVLLLLLFRFVPLPGTPQMLWSLIEGQGAHYAWSDHVSPYLVRTVIGSEDQNFCSHRGFDWDEIDKAVAAHE